MTSEFNRCITWHATKDHMPKSSAELAGNWPDAHEAVLVVVHGPDGRRVDIDHLTMFANSYGWFFLQEDEEISHWAYLTDSFLP